MPLNLEFPFWITPATVYFAGLVTPGECQFNILVPGGLTGDNLVVLKVSGTSTQPNA